MSLIQSLKHALVMFSGLSRDALHVYLGLAVWLLAILLTRKSAGSLLPWLLVLALACVGEAFDGFYDLGNYSPWRVGAALYDIVNTTFWPGCFALLARYTRTFK